MKCKHCGKELIKVGELTDKEYEEIIFINKKFANSRQALNPETIKQMEFTEGQVFEYFRAAYDNIAQADFLQYIFFKNLGERLGINDKNIMLDDKPDSKDIFVHPDDKE